MHSTAAPLLPHPQTPSTPLIIPPPHHPSPPTHPTPLPQTLNPQEAKTYCREVVEFLRTLKASRDMTINEAKLVIAIEDPRARERRQLGVEVGCGAVSEGGGEREGVASTQPTVP